METDISSSLSVSVSCNTHTHIHRATRCCLFSELRTSSDMHVGLWQLKHTLCMRVEPTLHQKHDRAVFWGSHCRSFTGDKKSCILECTQLGSCHDGCMPVSVKIDSPLTFITSKYWHLFFYLLLLFSLLSQKWEAIVVITSVDSWRRSCFCLCEYIQLKRLWTHLDSIWWSQGETK